MVSLRIPENFLYYLSMHESCSEPQLCRAEKLTAEDVELSMDLEVVGIRKMIRSVLAEVYRMRAFVRLKPLGQSCTVRLHEAEAQDRRRYLQILRPKVASHDNRSRQQPGKLDIPLCWQSRVAGQ